jgi:hypothetical protein
MSNWSLATSLRLSSGFLSPSRPTTGQFLETDRDRLCPYFFQLVFFIILPAIHKKSICNWIRTYRIVSVLRFSQPSLLMVLSYEIRRHLVCWNSTDISEERVACVFRIEEKFNQGTSINKPASRACRLLVRLYLPHWRSRRYVPPKFQLTFTKLHGIVSQKMERFTYDYIYDMCRQFLK